MVLRGWRLPPTVVADPQGKLITADDALWMMMRRGGMWREGTRTRFEVDQTDGEMRRREQ